MAKHIDRLKQLRVYQTAFEVARTLFRASRTWPKEEAYALTDQARRSSRSVCANLAEAWGKRRYPRSFVSKLSDAYGEVLETLVWIDFAEDAGYLDPTAAQELRSQCDLIAGGLVKMMRHPDQWCGPSILREEQALYDIEDAT